MYIFTIFATLKNKHLVTILTKMIIKMSNNF